MARKRPKIICEIEECGVNDPKLLHRHHIVERKEIGTCNDDFNLAIICANHHAMVHAGKLRIIGVFPGTRPPTGRVLVYELDGKKNVDVDEAYFHHKPAGMKLIFKEEENGKKEADRS